jgi:DNA (cytosine-5)-methyltransferase 1
VSKQKKISTLSLFSGAGGLDIGFHQSGFKIEACVEIDPRFTKTLVDNPKYFGDSKIITKDIREVSFDEIGKKKNEIDFIIGGPPCQSFSAAGQRKGLDDHRGTLFKNYIKFIEYYRPKGFLFENVRGILYSNNGSGWKTILDSFKKIGYQVTFRLLNSADYGVPQLRERVFILGGLTKELSFPAPTHGVDSKSGKQHTTVLEAIKDIYNPREKQKPFGGQHGHLIPLVPEGDNYSYFTIDRGYDPPIFGWRTKFSTFMYKLAKNEPSRTIQAQPGKCSGPLHWLNRKLNADELIRLQTFPKDFIFNCGQTLIQHQIGNSVPPLLAKVLSESIYKQLNNMKINKDELIDKDFRFSFDAVKGKLAKKTRRKRSTQLKKITGQKELEFSCS